MLSDNCQQRQMTKIFLVSKQMSLANRTIFRITTTFMITFHWAVLSESQQSIFSFQFILYQAVKLDGVCTYIRSRSYDSKLQFVRYIYHKKSLYFYDIFVISMSVVKLIYKLVKNKKVISKNKIYRKSINSLWILLNGINYLSTFLINYTIICS